MKFAGKTFCGTSSILRTLFFEFFVNEIWFFRRFQFDFLHKFLRI